MLGCAFGGNASLCTICSHAGPVPNLGWPSAGKARRLRRPHAQPQRGRSHPLASPTGGVHRRERVGEVVAGLRHNLCRGAAALCGVPVRLRAPVPRADGEAGRRFDRRPVSSHFNRAEDHGIESALDGRHRHRNLRLPAAAVRQRRRAALPVLRSRDLVTVPRSHRRHGDAVSAG